MSLAAEADASAAESLAIRDLGFAFTTGVLTAPPANGASSSSSSSPLEQPSPSSPSGSFGAEGLRTMTYSQRLFSQNKFARFSGPNNNCFVENIGLQARFSILQSSGTSPIEPRPSDSESQSAAKAAAATRCDGHTRNHVEPSSLRTNPAYTSDGSNNPRGFIVLTNGNRKAHTTPS